MGPSQQDRKNPNERFKAVREYFSFRCKDFLVHSDGSERWFLPRGSASYILTKTEIEEREVVELMYHDTDRPMPTIGEALDKIMGQRERRSILLTILCSGTLSLLRQFGEKIIGEQCEWTDDDEDMPFERNKLQEIFAPKDAEEFYRLQFRFAALVLREGQYQVNGCKYGDRLRMPYPKSKEKLGNGAHGTVFRVEVAAGHFVLQRFPMANNKPVFLARKVFSQETRQAFKLEDAVLQDLASSYDVCPSSIMLSLCSLVHGVQSCSIFFPEARCNLAQYLDNKKNTVYGSDGKLLNIKRMIGVAVGLEWLGRRTKYDAASDTFIHCPYYHCDLKPENILVCESSNGLILKISDFGCAISTEMPVKDLPRKPREALFLPPEFSNRFKNGRISANTDVCSFGCILLCVLIFNIEIEGVDQHRNFLRDLISENPTQDSARTESFFENLEDPKKAGLKRWITKLTQSLQSSAYANDRVSQGLLKMLVDQILKVNPDQRMPIGEVLESMRKIYNYGIPVQPKPVTQRGDPMKDSVHCAQSPQGEYILFYSETNPSKITYIRNKIREPTAPQYLFAHSTGEQSKGSKSLRILLTSSCCGSSSFCRIYLHERGMKCQIFHVPEVPGQGQASKSFTLLYEGNESNSKDTIQKVAMSPDGRLLAVASQKSRLRSTRVQMFRIEDLIEEMPRREVQQTDMTMNSDGSFTGINVSNHTGLQSNKIEQEGSTWALQFSADSLMLYHCFRISRDSNNDDSAPKIEVRYWAAQGGALLGKSVVRDTPCDYQEFFVTSFAPLQHETGFLAVLYGNRVLRQSMNDNSPVEPLEPQGSPMLKTVLVTPDGDWAVFLGGKNTLEIYGARVANLGELRRLEIAPDPRRPRYDPQSDKACIHVSDRKFSLLVTWPHSQETLAFDLTALFSSSGNG